MRAKFRANLGDVGLYRMTLISSSGATSQAVPLASSFATTKLARSVPLHGDRIVDSLTGPWTMVKASLAVSIKPRRFLVQTFRFVRP